MPRLDVHYRRLLDWARERAPERFRPVIDAAEHGNEELMEVVVAFVKRASAGDWPGMQRLFARFPSIAAHQLKREPSAPPPPPPPPSPAPAEPVAKAASEPAPQPADDQPQDVLMPREMRKLALRRAEGVREPHTDSPDKIIEHIFDADGIRTAHDVKVGGPDTPTILQEVEGILVERVASRIIRALRPGRSVLEIPPPPSDDKFYELIFERLDADRGVIEAWSRSEMWKMVLVTLFTVFLAEGVGPIDRDTNSEAKERLAAIDLKKQWFHYLDSIGMDIRDVGRAFASHYGERDEETKLRVVAEYTRFDHSVREYLQGDPTSIMLLVKDMKVLHRAEPGLGAETFLSLLTPYVEPMTHAEIMRLLKQHSPDPEITDFERFVARSILEWHAGDPAALAGFLAKHIASSLKYESMQQLCIEALHIKRDGKRGKSVPSAFLAKMEELASSGVDTGPLIAAIDARFPGSLPARYRQLSIQQIGAASPQQGSDESPSAETSAPEQSVEGAAVALGEGSMAGATEGADELVQPGLATFGVLPTGGTKTG